MDGPDNKKIAGQAIVVEMARLYLAISEMMTVANIPSSLAAIMSFTKMNIDRLISNDKDMGKVTISSSAARSAIVYVVANIVRRALRLGRVTNTYLELIGQKPCDFIQEATMIDRQERSNAESNSYN